MPSPESSLSASLMPVQQGTAPVALGGACMSNSKQFIFPAPVDALSAQQQLSGFDVDAAGTQNSGRRQVKRSTTWPKQRMMCVIHEDGLQQSSNTTLGDDIDDIEYALEEALCAAAAPSPPAHANTAGARNAVAATASAVSAEQAFLAASPRRVSAAITSSWPVPAHSSSSSGGGVPAKRRGLIKRQSSATTGRELMRSACVTFADQAPGTANLSGRRRSLDTALSETHIDVQSVAPPAMVPSAAVGAVAAAPAGQNALNPHHRLPKRRASAPHLGSLPGAVPSASPARVPAVSVHAPSCQCLECLRANTAQLVQHLKQQQQPLQQDQSAAMKTGNVPHQPSVLSPQGVLTPCQPGGRLPEVYLQGSAALQGGASHQGSAGHLPRVYQQPASSQRSLSPGNGSAGQLPGVQQQGAGGVQGGLWHQSSLPSLATGFQPTQWNGQQAASTNTSVPLPGFADGAVLQMPQQQPQQGLMHWGSGSKGAAAAAVNLAHSPAGSFSGTGYAWNQGVAFDPLVTNTSGVGMMADQSLQHGLQSQTATLPRRSYEGQASYNPHSNNSSPVPSGQMVLSASMVAAPAMSTVSGSVIAGASPGSSTGVAAQRHLTQSIGMMSLSQPAGQQQQQQRSMEQQQQEMLTARQQLLQALQQRQRQQQLAALQQQQHAAVLQQQQQQLGRQHTSAAATVLAAARSNPEQVLGMLLQKAKHINLTPSQLEKLHRVVQLKQRLVASKVMLARMHNSTAPGQAAAAAAAQGVTGPSAMQQLQQQQLQGLCPPNCQLPCCQDVENELQQMMAMAQAEVARQPQHHQQQQGAVAPCTVQQQQHQQQQEGAVVWSHAGGGVATGAVAAMWQQSAAALGDPGAAAAAAAAMPPLNGSSGFPLQQQASASASLLSQGSNNPSSLLQQQDQQELLAATGGFGSFTALLQDASPAGTAGASTLQSPAAVAAAAVGPNGAVSPQQLLDVYTGGLGADLNLILDLNDLDVSSFGCDDDLIGFVNETVGTDETYLSVQAEFTKEQQRQERLKLYQQQVDKYKQFQQPQQQQSMQHNKNLDAKSNMSAGQAGGSASAAAAVAACHRRNTGPSAADAAADNWLYEFSLGLKDMDQDIPKLAP